MALRLCPPAEWPMFSVRQAFEWLSAGRLIGDGAVGGVAAPGDNAVAATVGRLASAGLIVAVPSRSLAMAAPASATARTPAIASARPCERTSGPAPLGAKAVRADVVVVAPRGSSRGGPNALGAFDEPADKAALSCWTE